MPSSQTRLSYTASAANLRRLLIIRAILAAGLLAALVLAQFHSPLAAIIPAVLAVVVILCVSIAITAWRLQQSWPVTDTEYFCQILIDLVGLSIVLYSSGGASNPFVSFYLVPLTISAAILPWRYTWFIAGFSLLAYSLMLFYYQPLPLLQPMTEHQHNTQGGFNLHIIGMWFTFALSTGLITYFVVRMANALRQQDRVHTENREDQLRDEQILAVATLAAGTAHELGTPLATMTVLLDEMEADYQQQPAFCNDLQTLKTQVNSCRHILQGLVSTAETHHHGQSFVVNAADYLEGILTHWQLLRPGVNYHFIDESQQSDRTIDVDPTLEQAILNLLNNAADACPDNIQVSLRCEPEQVILAITDHGPGIPFAIAEQMGKPFISTKRKGLGLGLFLSHATINRYGGRIELLNQPEGGTLARLTLPARHPFRP